MVAVAALHMQIWKLAKLVAFKTGKSSLHLNDRDRLPEHKLWRFIARKEEPRNNKSQRIGKQTSYSPLPCFANSLKRTLALHGSFVAVSPVCMPCMSKFIFGVMQNLLYCL